MKNKLFVVSDLHLEYKSHTEQTKILSAINNELSYVDRMSEQPIVLLCGDIGLFPFEWMAQINATVIYVLGNHEYWQQDYFEAKQKYKELASHYSNIHLLDNDILYLNNQLFIGSTLWTDCGANLNPDLVAGSNRVMRDIFEITANQWYQSEDNVKKLALANMLTENPTWNNIIQIDENTKAVNFFNMCYEMLDLFLHLKKHNVDLKSITSTNQFVTECLKHGAINTYCYDETTQAIYFKTLCEKYQPYFDLFIEKIDFNCINEELECVNVSHHHPFYEDIFIDSDIDTELLFTTIKGTQYPYHNYFYEMNKGRVYDDKNLFKLIHYHTNGSKLFNQHVLTHTHIWACGHKHYHTFNHRLKSIHLVSNPFNKNISEVLMPVEYISKDSLIQKVLSEGKLIWLLGSLERLAKTSEFIYNKNVYHLNKNTLIKWHASKSYLVNVNVFINTMKEYVNNVTVLSKKLNIAENPSFSYANEHIDSKCISIFLSHDFIKYEYVDFFIDDLEENHAKLHEFLFEVISLVKEDIKHINACINKHTITEPKQSFKFKINYDKFTSLYDVYKNEDENDF